MKILTLAQHDKHQTSDSQAICRRRSTLLPFLPGLRTNKLEAACRICIQQTLRQGAPFSNKNISNKLGPNRFFLGGCAGLEGVSINFWQKSWMISSFFFGVVDFGPGYLTSNPGNLGTALRVCPAKISIRAEG